MVVELTHAKSQDVEGLLYVKKNVHNWTPAVQIRVVPGQLSSVPLPGE